MADLAFSRQLAQALYVDCEAEIKSRYERALKELNIDLMVQGSCRVEIISGMVHTCRVLPTYQISTEEGCLRIFTPDGRLDTIVQMKNTEMNEYCSEVIPGCRYRFELEKGNQKTIIAFSF